MRALVRAVLLLAGVAITVGGVAAYAIASRGLSTRVAPTAVEVFAPEPSSTVRGCWCSRSDVSIRRDVALSTLARTIL